MFKSLLKSFRGPAPARTAPAGPDAAALIAQGKSNRQIAEALVLGQRTVETHVGNILSKLGAGSRQDIAGWMASQDVSGIA